MASDPVATGKLARFRRVIDIAGGVAALLAATVMLILGVKILRVVDAGPGPTAPVTSPVVEPIPNEPFDTQGAAILGNEEAPLVLVEFSDFQCPVCVRFSTVALPAFKSAYVATGKVALAFKHLPLESIHPLALAAAEASECAAAQGKFWKMHDALFALKGQLQREKLDKAAESIELDPAGFKNCMNGSSRDKVRADIDAATLLSLRGTPTFLLGIGKPNSKVRITARFSGIPKPEVLSKAIDDALAQVQTLARREQ